MVNINGTVWQLNPPKTSGRYKYRWQHGTKEMMTKWNPVVVYLNDGLLLVVDPKHSDSHSPIRQYTDAEWKSNPFWG